MIACEECDQWFHTACFNLSSEQIDDENYVFICADCDKKIKKDWQRQENTAKLGLKSAGLCPAAILISKLRRREIN